MACYCRVCMTSSSITFSFLWYFSLHYRHLEFQINAVILPAYVAVGSSHLNSMIWKVEKQILRSIWERTGTCTVYKHWKWLRRCSNNQFYLDLTHSISPFALGLAEKDTGQGTGRGRAESSYSLNFKRTQTAP